MADNIIYRFIQNVGDYFPTGYFNDKFFDSVKDLSGVSNDEVEAMNKRLADLRTTYEAYKNVIINNNPRVKDAIRHTHEWHTALLKVLGYDTSNAYQEAYVVKEAEDVVEMIPVRHILRSGKQISLLIMEMQHLIAVNEQSPAGLFEQQYESETSEFTREQRYYAGQWSEVIPAQFLDKEHYRFSPTIINKAITQIFLMPEERRPNYILMLAGNTVFLFDKEKWARGSYLQFSIDELYTQGQNKNTRKYYTLFQLLVNKNALSADGQIVLMEKLVDESYKNAYEVTKDLKRGVILAVETLANEALYYMREVAQRPFGKEHREADGSLTYDESDPDFATQVKDDCLTIVYRLLFILFAESRGELDILPTNDEVYKRGYSFEALRDLEQVRLNSEETRNGYFFDDSIRHLFSILSQGFNATDGDQGKSFRVRAIDSPIFDDERLLQLKDVRIRNVKWQEIIRALSLSQGAKSCGRISYANLGVNQLGSVYESLLAYRGFYAEEDYIEVHTAKKTEEGTFLVPYSRLEDFKNEEVLRNEEGEIQRLKKGSFVYRLNGRDREKSASYYTPEVLTRSTIKYTIEAFINEVREGKRKPAELLDLKILEPAVGAAAFLNEIINQLAEAYMTYVPKKPAPDRYRDELQKVKAYIATHNVYGVDLNPTAIELGKLSLWLNVMHKDMEPPFFGHRLAVGNAVVGAWLKVYRREEVVGKKGVKKLKPTPWWEGAPRSVKFYRNRVNRSVHEVYHFLLPDKKMLEARNVDGLKEQHPAEVKGMAERIKDWTSAIGETEFQILQRLSEKIDFLLREVLETQVNVTRLTSNERNIWPHESAQLSDFFERADQAEKYADKERLFASRNHPSSAFFKLKQVMDYWCALWFWDYSDASALPTRAEYWEDIESLLDVSEEQLKSQAKSASVCQEPDSFFSSGHITEEEAGIAKKTRAEIMAHCSASTSLFGAPNRLQTVQRLAQHYRFFHPMLEFIEVFWLRGGFDVICGNPPWLVIEFDEQGVVSERYPEVVIRNFTADATRAKAQEIIQEDEALKRIYEEEQLDMECSQNFLNAVVNYGLLKGQQTDLYKCVLSNTLDLISPQQGYIGILCPESIYDDAKGQRLRRALYPRLRYHFQYQNEKALFVEVNKHVEYGSQILGPAQVTPRFVSISNLYAPSTVDACFAHDGHGRCGGLKDQHGKWNTAGHRDRMVPMGEAELRLLAQTFERSDDWQAAKLVTLQSRKVLDVLQKINNNTQCLADRKPIISEGFHETGAVKDGTIKRCTKLPDWNQLEMIYSGPHVYVSQPLYKTPRTVCKEKSDYDVFDLEKVEAETTARTNYVPAVSLPAYNALMKGFDQGQTAEGECRIDNWMDYYKVGFRKMISIVQERSLICAILPPKSAHVFGIISVVFRELTDVVDLTSLCSSLVLDFYMKTMGATNLQPTRMEPFPMGDDERFRNALRARTLRLNCVTQRYAPLWEELWQADFRQEAWSLEDERLSPWHTLKEKWEWATPLRNAFERRMALVEIDVLAAMMLGLSLDDLLLMYELQFPVLQKKENDTWYDRHGRVVFTTSNGVGVDRKTWKSIQHLTEGETYTHTLTSELYAGETMVYEAPFTCCDRVEDYRRAWQCFEARFS